MLSKKTISLAAAALVSASCRRLGKAPSANPAKARENVASLGIARILSQPHRRRSAGSLVPGLGRLRPR